MNVRKYQDKEYREMSAKIVDISNIGEVTIEFGQPMKLQNITHINNETLSLTIYPFEENPNANKLNFTWNCTDFNSEQMIPS